MAVMTSGENGLKIFLVNSTLVGNSSYDINVVLLYIEIFEIP